MTKRKTNLQKLNSPRIRAINRYTNKLHDKVDLLYENLMDNDIDSALSIQKELINELRNLKIEEEGL